MSCALKGTGRLVLIEPFMVKVEVVLWSLEDVLEEPVSVADPEDWVVVEEAKTTKLKN